MASQAMCLGSSKQVPCAGPLSSSTEHKLEHSNPPQGQVTGLFPIASSMLESPTCSLQRGFPLSGFSSSCPMASTGCRCPFLTAWSSFSLIFLLSAAHGLHTRAVPRKKEGMFVQLHTMPVDIRNGPSLATLSRLTANCERAAHTS